jgi:NTP pyrophosphatase (non-canonical NTP hydrolase)
MIKNISLHSYQTDVVECLAEGDEICWALGLVGEAGEVSELIKKKYYHGGTDKKGIITPHRILDECGDVLWYLTAMLGANGFSLQDCMDANATKLSKRFPEGKFNVQQAHLQADYK